MWGVSTPLMSVNPTLWEKNDGTFFWGGLWGWHPLFLFLKQQGLLPIRPFVSGIWELIKVQTKDYLFISFTHKRPIKQVVKIKKDPCELIYTLIFSWWFLEVHVSLFPTPYVTCSVFPVNFLAGVFAFVDIPFLSSHSANSSSFF